MLAGQERIHFHTECSVWTEREADNGQGQRHDELNRTVKAQREVCGRHNMLPYMTKIECKSKQLHLSVKHSVFCIH